MVKIEKINLRDKFTQIHDHWHPRIAGELNGQQIKLAKVKGSFVWHKHEHEDEMFMVIRGKLTINLRESTIELGPGECIIIPRGIEHQPVAREETEIMLFEPAGTLNTGDTQSPLTRHKLRGI